MISPIDYQAITLGSIQNERIKNNIKDLENVFIFPFSLVSGIVHNTEYGLKENFHRIDDFTQYERIFTGEELVMAQWDNSQVIELSDKLNGVGVKGLLKQTYKKGDYIRGVLFSSNVDIDFQTTQKNLGGFVNQVDTKYLSFATLKKFTKEDIYKMYIVPFNISEKHYVELGDDNNLYRVESVNAYYDAEGKFVYNIVNLKSLTDELSTTGKMISQKILFGGNGIGSGYAFPKLILDENNKIVDFELDPKRLRDIGVKWIQVELMGPNALIAIKVYGRPIDKAFAVNEYIYPSRPLIFDQIQLPIITQISNRTNPSPVIVAAGLNNDIYSYYKNWTEFWQGKWDELTKKQFLGILQAEEGVKWKDIEETNPKGKAINDIDLNFLSPNKQSSPLNWTYHPITNNFFAANQDNSYEIVGGLSFNYYDHLNTKTSNFGIRSHLVRALSMNSFLFHNYEIMPLTISQILNFRFTDIPIIGKFLNALSLGFSFNFRKFQTSTDLFALKTRIMFLISKDFFKFNSNVLWGSENSTPKIAMDAFMNQEDNELNSLIGAQSLTSGYLLRLTDKIDYVEMWERLPGNKWSKSGSGYAISTVLLGKQGKIGNSNYEKAFFYNINSFPLFNWKSTSYLNYCDYVKNNDNEQSYIIDMIGVQALFKGDIRVSCYYDNPNDDTLTYKEFVLNQFVYQSNAKYTNNILNLYSLVKTSNLDNWDKNPTQKQEWPKRNDPVTSLVIKEIKDYSTYVYHTFNLEKDFVGLDGISEKNEEWEKGDTRDSDYKLLLTWDKLNVSSFAEFKNYYKSLILNISIKVGNGDKIYSLVDLGGGIGYFVGRPGPDQGTSINTIYYELYNREVFYEDERLGEYKIDINTSDSKIYLDRVYKSAYFGGFRVVENYFPCTGNPTKDKEIVQNFIDNWDSKILAGYGGQLIYSNNSKYILFSDNEGIKIKFINKYNFYHPFNKEQKRDITRRRMLTWYNYGCKAWHNRSLGLAVNAVNKWNSYKKDHNDKAESNVKNKKGFTWNNSELISSGFDKDIEVHFELKVIKRD